MRKTLFAFIAALLLVALPVFAGPTFNFGKGGAAACTPTETSKMVLNVIYQVTNDIDSGVAGNYWAQDAYTKHVQVFDMGGSTFCVKASYKGSFVTFTGTSPDGLGVNVSAGVTGTMEGGFSGVITGTFVPLTQRTKGNIGSKDFGCIQDGSCAPDLFSWLSKYFTGTFSYSDWSWTYDAGDNGTWVNSSSGNSGNISGSSF